MMTVSNQHVNCNLNFSNYRSNLLLALMGQSIVVVELEQFNLKCRWIIVARVICIQFSGSDGCNTTYTKSDANNSAPLYPVICIRFLKKLDPVFPMQITRPLHTQLFASSFEKSGCKIRCGYFDLTCSFSAKSWP